MLLTDCVTERCKRHALCVDPESFTWTLCVLFTRIRIKVVVSQDGHFVRRALSSVSESRDLISIKEYM